jgi:multiple sugar transport system permease protein
MSATAISELQSAPAKPPKKRNTLVFWLLLPSLIIFAAFAIWPTLEAMLISLSRYNLTDPNAQRTFIGLENYRYVLSDKTFWGDLGRSFKFVIVSVAVSLTLGFYIAYLLSKAGRGKGLFRILFLVPMTVSPAITALSFKFMLNYDFGIINVILDKLAGVKVNLLGDASLAIWATVGIDVWIWTPLVVLIILSGLESLPEEVFEAAALDGAGTESTLLYVTIPMMKRFLLIAVLIRVMDAFRVYETIQLTTAGGPGNLSETLNVYIARVGFSFFELGRASAMAMILTFIIIATGTILVRKSSAFEESYQ